MGCLTDYHSHIVRQDERLSVLSNKPEPESTNQLCMVALARWTHAALCENSQAR